MAPQKDIHFSENSVEYKKVLVNAIGIPPAA